MGVLLFAFYGPHSDPAYSTLPSGVATLPVGGTFQAVTGDRVFPDFITKHMPSGLSGLVVAAIFAAALSSSLNSIAATAVNDLYKPFAKKRSDKHYLRVSRWLTLAWGVVQVGVAVAAMSYPSSALDKALSVASLINGPVLGVFLVGTFLRRVSEPPALIGMVASLLVMSYVRFYTPVAWTWYVLLGSGVTFFVAWLAGFAFPAASAEKRDELAPGGAAE
jgi:Na+/proline symporter